MASGLSAVDLIDSRKPERARVFQVLPASLRATWSVVMESARRLPIASYVPIGLSFLSVRALSYAIDVYRGDIRGSREV